METMRETTLDNKVSILAHIGLLHADSDFFEALVSVHNVGFPLCWLLKHEYITDISDKGVEQVEQAWLVTLKILEVEDIGFSDLTQLLATSSRYSRWIEEGFEIDEDEVH